MPSTVRKINRALVKTLDKLYVEDRAGYTARLVELATEALFRYPKLHSKQLGVEIGIVGVDKDGDYVDPTNHETRMYSILKDAPGVQKATKGKADWKLTTARRKAMTEAAKAPAEVAA